MVYLIIFDYECQGFEVCRNIFVKVGVLEELVWVVVELWFLILLIDVIDMVINSDWLFVLMVFFYYVMGVCFCFDWLCGLCYEVVFDQYWDCFVVCCLMEDFYVS